MNIAVLVMSKGISAYRFEHRLNSRLAVCLNEYAAYAINLNIHIVAKQGNIIILRCNRQIIKRFS